MILGAGQWRCRLAIDEHEKTKLLALQQLFPAWLERHYPERSAKVLNRIRELRGGALNDPRFGKRMRGAGPWAEQIRSMFELGCRRAGLARSGPSLDASSFRRPPDAQLELF